jgi:hypothetical protein
LILPAVLLRFVNACRSIERECVKRQKAKYKEMKAQLKENESRTEAWAEQLGSEDANQEISQR